MEKLKIVKDYSKEMMNWAKTLWPYNRSLTGKGNIKTLNFLNKILKKLENIFCQLWN